MKNANSIPWQPYKSFMEWMGTYPRTIDCGTNNELTVAILKHAFQHKWGAIGSERFWYSHAPTRMRETNEYHSNIDNNIEEMLRTVNLLVLTDIDRVEVKFHERLFNILLARDHMSKITVFTVFNSITDLSPGLCKFLAQAENVRSA